MVRRNGRRGEIRMGKHVFVALAFLFATWAGPVSAQTQYDELIEQKCAEYGCDAEGLKRVAMCESNGIHQFADGTYPTGFYGEVGLFQFRPDGMWGVVYDVSEQVDIAAHAFTHGLGFHWSCEW